jgi:hypothetical protein
MLAVILVVPYFWPNLPEVGIFYQNSSSLTAAITLDTFPTRGLGYEQVHMLRHHNKPDNIEAIPISHLLQNLKQKVAALGSPTTAADRNNST